jgi:hypothetical protein
MMCARAARAPSRSGFTISQIHGIMCACPPLPGHKPIPKDPFIREKFTREQSAARKHAREYFERYPKDQTEVESWRPLQSFNIEFTMKRLREPIAGTR